VFKQEEAMPGKWHAMYFDRMGAALEAGPVGRTAIRKMSPLTFVAADVLDTLSWSLVTGCGMACLHGAITQLSKPQSTITLTVASVGCALLAPVVKDSVVSVLADVAELLERRHVAPTQPDPDNTPITQLPEREVLRVVPVHNANAALDPVIRLPDGRELDARKVRDFAIGAKAIGLGLVAWKGRGWTRTEWETVRDLLGMHNLATPRADGQAGKLTATPGQCMRAFGL
jgi:hypothetical protein